MQRVRVREAWRSCGQACNDEMNRLRTCEQPVASVWRVPGRSRRPVEARQSVAWAGSEPAPSRSASERGVGKDNLGETPWAIGNLEARRLDLHIAIAHLQAAEAHGRVDVKRIHGILTVSPQ